MSVEKQIGFWGFQHDPQSAEFRVVEPDGTTHAIKESVILHDPAMTKLVAAMARALTQHNLMAVSEKSSENFDAMKKDAERYRWLRAGNAYVPEECCVTGGVELDEICDAKVGDWEIVRQLRKEYE